MTLKNLVLTGAALLFSTPLFATTYFGGVEDWTGLDYDYNDAVFSVKSNDLKLQTQTGQWFAQPALGTGGMPFWNHMSLDGPNDNIGYCIYGGGSCNGGHAVDAGADYLASSATSQTGSTNDVAFSSTSEVTLDVAFGVTAGQDRFGWYSLSDPNSVHWFSQGATKGSYTFDPNGGFGLVSENLTPYFNLETYEYYSQSWLGSQDTQSHFAFFGDPAATVTPEPGLEGMVGLGLLGAGAIARRRKKS